VKQSQTFFIYSIVYTLGCVVSAQPSAASGPAPAATPASAANQHIDAGERGNWVLKRKCVREAQSVNQQLQKDAVAAQKARSKFSTELERIEKKILDFYSEKGFAKGKITALVDELKEDVQKDKDRRIAAAIKKSERDDAPINFYEVQVEAIEKDTKRLLRDFDQFNLDMKSIADLEGSIKERMKTVDKNIKDATDAATQGAKKFDEIWWIIDDQKASDAYYALQGLSDKVAAIKSYLEDTLFNDFKTVTGTLEKQIDQVNKQVDALEQRGLLLIHRSVRLKTREVAPLDEPTTVEESEEQEEAQVRTRPKKAESWWEGLLALPGQWWRSVCSSVEAVGALLWGSSKPPVRARRRRAVEQEPQEEPAVESSPEPGAEK